MRCLNNTVSKLKFIILLVILVAFGNITTYAITDSEFNSKLNQLRSEFPNYSVWNGSYNGGTQCYGFAYMMGYRVFGSNPATWNKVYSMDNVKAGDLIQYGNTSGAGHTVFVTNVSGSTITFVDCNGNGNYSGSTQVRNCGIKWDSSIQKNAKMFNKYAFSYVVSSPGIINSTPSDHPPVSRLETCTAGYNEIHVVGWTYDPDAQGESLDVHVYVGGEAGSGASCYVIKADKERSDVNGTCGVTGSHGFDEIIRVAETGMQDIFVYAINKGGTYHPLIGTSNVNILSDTECPVIKSFKISNVSSKGYTVTCEVSDNVGISRVQFPSWTVYAEQDDLSGSWADDSFYSGTVNGSTVTYRVNMADHNNETGVYKTHIYAYDEAGNVAVAALKTEIANGLTPVKTAVYNGHIYAAFTESFKWTEAKKECENMGGHLVTITSEEENRIVKGLTADGTDGYYIGATDKAAEGNWSWITGERFSYTNWNSTQPDNWKDTEDYGMIYADSGWNDVPDSNGYAFGFILEIDSTLAADKQLQYGNSSYSLYDISMPWEIAKLYCELQGGQLACITTEEENKHIAELAESGNRQSYFLGASDKDKEGSWNWISGESFSHQNWCAGQPDNRSGDAVKGPENYLCYDTYNDGWMDVKSSLNSIGFICKKQNPLSITVSSDKDTVVIRNAVTLRAQALGGSGSYIYSYLVHNKDTDAWNRLTPSFIQSSTYTWTAGSAGNREFFVEVKDSTGTVKRSSALTVKTVSALSVLGKSSTASVAVGDKVVLTGTAAGGSGSYTYSYLIHNKDTDVWFRLTPSFIQSNIYTWTAGSVGNREFYVEVKDAAGNVVRSNAVNVCVKEQEKALSITGRSNLATVIKGNTIVLTGTASGGSGNYTYSYLVHNKDTDSWFRLTPSFIQSNTYTWIAGSSGNREFFIEVKDGTGRIVRSSAIAVKTTEAAASLSITGRASNSVVTAGTKVVISGTAAGGNGNYSYSYLIHNKDTNAWFRLTPSFIQSNTYTWIAGSAGNREFFVEVKDSNGKVVRSNAVNVKVQ